MERTKPVRVSLLGGLCLHPSTWHTYQRYYLMGLRQMPGLRVDYVNPVDRGFAWARERGLGGSARTWEYLAKWRPNGRYDEATHVGRYLVHFAESPSPVRVVIDAHDMRTIRDPKAHEWADIYFKANRWPGIDYGYKVHPVVSGNGFLDRSRIARLRSMRDHAKTLDLVLIAKLWPSAPGPTYWNPVEHLVRVFEILAKLKIRSLLRAIVPRKGEIAIPQHHLSRLERCGVHVTVDNVTVDELWGATASARLAFLRPGKHLCVSWRMIDHLALGASTVCDRGAYPEWPVPLRGGHEFIDCGCGIGQDESLPEPADYARIADTVMEILADRKRDAEVRRAAADYFDHHAAPERIARYLLETVRTYSGLPGASPSNHLPRNDPSRFRAAASEQARVSPERRHGQRREEPERRDLIRSEPGKTPRRSGDRRSKTASA